MSHDHNSSVISEITRELINVTELVILHLRIKIQIQGPEVDRKMAKKGLELISLFLSVLLQRVEWLQGKWMAFPV